MARHMPWKMDGEQIVVENGMPVWTYDDGKESPFNAESALNRIKELTGESVSRKNKLKDLESKYSGLADIDNVDDWLKSAREAMETVANYKDKEIVDAGEIEKLKKSVSDGYDKKIEEINKAHNAKVKEFEDLVSKKDGMVQNLLVRNAFDNSEFIREETFLTPAVAFATFGNSFTIEERNGKLAPIAKRADGSEIFSLENPGNPASPDEAIRILVGEHPDCDHLKKGMPGGSGAQGVGSGGKSGAITRTQFGNMTPADQMKYIKDGGTVKD
jgi:hypothetical protein